MLLAISGAALAAKPERQIEQRFKGKDGEATELYPAFVRPGGLYFIIGAIVCAAAAVLWAGWRMRRSGKWYFAKMIRTARGPAPMEDL